MMGETHVQGIMDGEVFEELRNGRAQAKLPAHCLIVVLVRRVASILPLGVLYSDVS